MVYGVWYFLQNYPCIMGFSSFTCYFFMLLPWTLKMKYCWQFVYAFFSLLFCSSFLHLCFYHSNIGSRSKTTASCFIKLNKDTINIILLFPQQLTGTYHFTCMVFLCVFFLVKENCICGWKYGALLYIYVSSFSIFLYNSTI